MYRFVQICSTHEDDRKGCSLPGAWRLDHDRPLCAYFNNGGFRADLALHVQFDRRLYDKRFCVFSRDIVVGCQARD